MRSAAHCSNGLPDAIPRAGRDGRDAHLDRGLPGRPRLQAEEGGRVRVRRSLDARAPRSRLPAARSTLNRRLAPDVYLGVEAVTDREGVVVDHVVVMQRMPADRRLSTLVRKGVDVTACLDRVADTVARFHAHASTDPTVALAATHDAVTELWELGFEQTRRFEGLELDRSTARCVATLVRRYLAGRDPLFARRIAAGHARDGHGDLLAEDVFCLDDGPRILDCLEFDERLRFGDVLGDVAFLAMDLERLGRPGSRAPLPRSVPRRRTRLVARVARTPLHRVPGARARQGRLPARHAGKPQCRGRRRRAARTRAQPPRSRPGAAGPRRRSARDGQDHARNRDRNRARLAGPEERRRTQRARRARTADPRRRATGPRPLRTNLDRPDLHRDDRPRPIAAHQRRERRPRRVMVTPAMARAPRRRWRARHAATSSRCDATRRRP